MIHEWKYLVFNVISHLFHYLAENNLASLAFMNAGREKGKIIAKKSIINQTITSNTPQSIACIAHL